jgi:hypothetical protein
MKRLRVWGLSAALAAGGGSALASDPPSRQPEQTTLMNKLFGPRQPKPVGPAVASPPDRPITVSVPLPREVLADALEAERAAYLRRVSICLELQRIAIEKGDGALERQADELARQAAALYNARAASLGVPRTKAPLPEPAPKGNAFVTFDDPLPTDPLARAHKLEAPAAPVPGTTTAQVREVKP